MPILRTALLVTILIVVGATALSEIGVNIAPLLAGAGILGIAVGFGSQTLVHDIITGMFILIENTIQVGDGVTVAGLTGTVELLSLRTLRLRAGDGSLHVIPFSSVVTITNTNRGIGNAAVSVMVAPDADIDRVIEALAVIGKELRGEPKFAPSILGDLEVWGVDAISAKAVTLDRQDSVHRLRQDAGSARVQPPYAAALRRRADCPRGALSRAIDFPFFDANSFPGTNGDFSGSGRNLTDMLGFEAGGLAETRKPAECAS